VGRSGVNKNVYWLSSAPRNFCFIMRLTVRGFQENGKRIANVLFDFD
jgi:hypothetical protein